MSRSCLAPALAAFLVAASLVPMSLAQNGAQNIEQFRLDFEKEKWRTEAEFRTRELVLKEREQAASRWTNPLVVAILAAAVAAFGNTIVAVINGRLQRRLDASKQDAELALERSKAESARILEMIKTGDTEAAARNLQFLVDMELISKKDGQAEKLGAFLSRRTRGTGPSLPAPTAHIGFEPTEYLTPSIRSELQRSLDDYAVYLNKIGFPPDPHEATIRVDKLETGTAYYDDATAKVVIDARIIGDTHVALHEYTHHVLSLHFHTEQQSTHSAGYALDEGLADYFAASFLNDPMVGQIAAKVNKATKPFVRMLENGRKFSEYKKISGSFGRHFELAEILGGAFWEMRTKMGADTFDPLLVKAWLSLSTDRYGPDSYEDFIGILLNAQGVAKDSSDAIRAVLQAREFPLPGPRGVATA